MSRVYLFTGSIITGGNCPGAIIWVAIFRDGYYPGDNCPRGNCPRWELSEGGIVREEAIVLGGNFPGAIFQGENCPGPLKNME